MTTCITAEIAFSFDRGLFTERKTELTIFLDFLHSRKARSLDQIQPFDLSDFIIPGPIFL